MYEVLDVQDDLFFTAQRAHRSLSKVPTVYVVVVHPYMSTPKFNSCDAPRVKLH